MIQPAIKPLSATVVGFGVEVGADDPSVGAAHGVGRRWSEGVRTVGVQRRYTRAMAACSTDDGLADPAPEASSETAPTDVARITVACPFRPDALALYVNEHPEPPGETLEVRMSETRDAQEGGRQDRPFPITVKTLAGHSRHEQVRPSDRVQEVTEDAVRFFVHRGELEAGPYALTLPRAGDADLDPTGTLAEVGVVRDDVLVLVSRTPQVDG